MAPRSRTPACFLSSGGVGILVIISFERVIGLVRDESTAQFAGFEHVQPVYIRQEWSPTLQDNGRPKNHSLRLRFNAFGFDYRVHAELHTKLFCEKYKEVVLENDGSFLEINRGVPKCLFKGVLMDGLGLQIGSAHLSTCSGGVNGVVRHPNATLEIRHVAGENSHFVIDLRRHKPTERHDCGVDDTHHHNHDHPPRRASQPHHHSHIHDHHSPSPWHRPRSKIHTLSATCESSPTKFVDILLINDQRRFDIRGDDTESQTLSIFNILDTYYIGGEVGNTTYSGVRDGNLFKCSIQPRLVGQLTFATGNPSYLQYRTSGCDKVCGGTRDCRDGEISANCLLESFRDYTVGNTAGLKGVFGNVDHYMLLTDENFNQGIIGLAYVKGMCTSWSNSVIQSTSNSVVYTAYICAHELGHAFGMVHDSSSGFVMQSTVSFRNIPRDFSSTSRAEIDTFMNTVSLSCLANDTGTDRSDEPKCGNGWIEDGEECDPGFRMFENDPCCSSDCKLEPNCQCSNSQPCCENGRFRDSNYICRPSRTSQCDFDELCTGTNAECPTDLFMATSTICSDVSANGVAGIGMCYQGQCISVADNCPSNLPYPFESLEPVCNNVACREGTSGTGFFQGPARVGTPCGNGRVCTDLVTEGDRCVEASSVRFYHWFISCPSSLMCRDEEGRSVDHSLCQGTPPNCGPGTTFTPTVSSQSPTIPFPQPPSPSSDASFPPNPTNTLYPTVLPSLSNPRDTIIPSDSGMTISPSVETLVRDTVDIETLSPSVNGRSLTSMNPTSFAVAPEVGDQSTSPTLSEVVIGQTTNESTSNMEANFVFLGVTAAVALAIISICGIMGYRYCCLRCKLKKFDGSYMNSAKPHGRRKNTVVKGTSIDSGDRTDIKRPSINIIPSPISIILPPGWHKEVTKDGRDFYYHAGKKKSQWKLPRGSISR